jgi:hypothetical protein
MEEQVVIEGAAGGPVGRHLELSVSPEINHRKGFEMFSVDVACHFHVPCVALGVCMLSSRCFTIE